MIEKLGGKVALVTGAGSGIGRATAETFASEGAAVAVLDRLPDAAEETAALISFAGGRAIAVTADVANDGQVRAAIARTVQQLGRLDVLINNAAIDTIGSVAATTEDDWDRCFAVNVKGTYLCSRAALGHLESGSAIVNLGSIAGLVGVPERAAYSASKGAVISLTRSMAIDFAPRGIRGNAVCPGAGLTPLMAELLRARGGGNLDAGIAATVIKYPIGRLGTPSDIARAVLYLAGDDAAFVTGTILTADGGATAQ